MDKYKVQMVHEYTGAVEEDCVDDMIFDTEPEADEYACYMRSCAAEGAEILKMSNPFDYEEDYGDGENYDYIVVEVEQEEEK